MPSTSLSTAIALGAVAIAAAGCGGAKDPLSKSHDIVARTVGRDLTVSQTSALLERSNAPTPTTVANAVAVANLWASYQRLGYAAAHDDSLESHFSAALTPAMNMARVNLLLERLRGPAAHDSATRADFDSAAHGLYAVRHILFAFPPAATQSQKDSVATLAAVVWSKLTPANFQAMAKKYSADTGSASKGGYLGIFAAGAMNPTAARMIAALKPDSISKVLRTQLGVDVVQRVSWEDAKADFTTAMARATNMGSDTAVIGRASRAANLTVTSAAPDAARAAATNPVQGSRDSTLIATFDRGGKFTTSDLVGWINLMEPSARAQVLRDLPQQADVVASAFVRTVASRAILLRAADSAGIAVPDTLRSKLHEQFRADLVKTWRALGVAPDQLADSAKTTAERELLAARRVDRFMERSMAGEVAMTPVSIPVETALDAKYNAVISTPAIERATGKP